MRLAELEELQQRVEKVWEETRLLYEEELEIQLLQRELEQAERWLSTYESTLTAKDYGVRRPPLKESLRTLWTLIQHIGDCGAPAKVTHHTNESSPETL